MEVVILLAFVGLVLVALALVLFLHSQRARDYQFADRIALFPIEDESPAKSVASDPRKS